MKIWISFDSVSALQIGGLERCSVWWQRPYYVFLDRSFEYDSLPFGGGNQKQGLCNIGWRYTMTEGKETRHVSLGKIFDYEGDICDLVWDKLCEFFQSEDLRLWDKQAEKLKIEPKDFLLELDVVFNLKTK